MWAHVYTHGYLGAVCAHMCGVYVAKCGGNQELLLPPEAFPTPSPAHPLCGPLSFHVCGFWRQKSKRMVTLAHRVLLCGWGCTCASVRGSECDCVCE